jgi:hypothetical protein
MKSKIYSLTDEFGVVRYVGKTSKSLNRRLIQHKSEARNKNTHKCRWISSMLNNGLVPKISMIGEYDDSIIGGMEKFWINYFRMNGNRLTNCTDGGEGVSAPSAETRLKMSNARKGIKLSDSTKKKISDFQKKPVLRYDICGNFIKEYESILDTEKDGFIKSCVGRCCTLERPTHKKNIFKFK